MVQGYAPYAPRAADCPGEGDRPLLRWGLPRSVARTTVSRGGSHGQNPPRGDARRTECRIVMTERLTIEQIEATDGPQLYVSFDAMLEANGIALPPRNRVTPRRVP